MLQMKNTMSIEGWDYQTTNAFKGICAWLVLMSHLFSEWSRLGYIVIAFFVNGE